MRLMGGLDNERDSCGVHLFIHCAGGLVSSLTGFNFLPQFRLPVLRPYRDLVFIRAITQYCAPSRNLYLSHRDRTLVEKVDGVLK